MTPPPANNQQSTQAHRKSNLGHGSAPPVLAQTGPRELETMTSWWVWRGLRDDRASFEGMRRVARCKADEPAMTCGLSFSRS